MICHVSVEADNPREVAEALAEIWAGVATPFPPVVEGAWIAMAKGNLGTAVEVYPRGTDLTRQDDDAPPESIRSAFYGIPGERVGPSNATHLAISTDLDEDAVLAWARRQGLDANVYRRGGAFGVIEVWIEDRLMVEILTPEMQAEYRALMNIPAWTGLLKQIGVSS